MKKLTLILATAIALNPAVLSCESEAPETPKTFKQRLVELGHQASEYSAEIFCGICALTIGYFLLRPVQRPPVPPAKPQNNNQRPPQPPVQPPAPPVDPNPDDELDVPVAPLITAPPRGELNPMGLDDITYRHLHVEESILTARHKAKRNTQAAPIAPPDMIASQDQLLRKYATPGQIRTINSVKIAKVPQLLQTGYALAEKEPSEAQKDDFMRFAIGEITALCKRIMAERYEDAFTLLPQLQPLPQPAPAPREKATATATAAAHETAAKIREMENITFFGEREAKEQREKERSSKTTQLPAAQSAAASASE